MSRHLDHNRRAWDERARRRDRHTRSALAKDLPNPLPILDPENWLEGNVRGRRVLCLASGGGLQSAMLAAAGAVVTVVDLSPAMLDLDQAKAKEHGFHIITIHASMDHLPMLAEGAFDIVLQPVSTCYVPDVRAVYREVARVLKPGGLYISQHKQPASLQAEAGSGGRGYVVTESAGREGPLPPCAPCLHREADTLEYVHRWQALLGGLCRAGFVIEDLVEPLSGADVAAQPGSFEHRSAFLPPYVKIKARRVGSGQSILLR